MRYCRGNGEPQAVGSALLLEAKLLTLLFLHSDNAAQHFKSSKSLLWLALMANCGMGFLSVHVPTLAWQGKAPFPHRTVAFPYGSVLPTPSLFHAHHQAPLFLAFSSPLSLPLPPPPIYCYHALYFLE